MDIGRAARIWDVMDGDLIICGGGLGGTALALATARAGLSVTLIDSLPRETRAAPG
ncbi:MAG: FAD-dependent oxidoreductase, partial [Pseudomonadota bacterium]